MYTLILSEKFQKQAKKIVTQNLSIKKRLAKVFEILRRDVTHPSLRLHKLTGVNNWSISVDKSIRIICHIDKDSIFLLRIGTHDEVY